MNSATCAPHDEEDRTAIETKAKLKATGLILAAILVVIIVVQNTEAVETRLLFVTVSMPRAVLLFSTALLGFVIGLLAAWRLGRREDK